MVCHIPAVLDRASEELMYEPAQIVVAVKSL
jgi:hypothetical protein